MTRETERIRLTLDRIRKFFSGGLDIVELAGLLIIAFAVTEPDAGSDVAGIRTRAVREGGPSAGTTASGTCSRGASRRSWSRGSRTWGR